MAKIKPCGGLAIARNGRQFTFSWKNGQSDYDAVQLIWWFYHMNNASTKKVSQILTGSTTSLTKTLLSNYGIRKIAFQVRGKKGSTWSALVTKDISMAPPYAPSVSSELTSNSNESKFSYSVSISDTDNRPFTHSEYQTVLVEDCNTADGSAVNWNYAESGTASSAFEMTRQETGISKQSYSYTRWFRARSNGWGGASEWVYTRHVYATPNRAANVAAYYEKLSGTGYSVLVNWDSPNSVARPIDSVTVNYSETEPTCTVTTDTTNNIVKMSLSCPTSGVSWTALNAVGGIGGRRALSFSVGSNIDNDKCVFARVDNKHDNNITAGDPVLVSGGLGKLTAPSISSVTPGQSANLYTITVNRNTSITNAFIAVYLRTNLQPNLNAIIGIIPANSSTTNLIIPTPSEGEELSFGVRAFVANYSPASAAATGPTYYSITDISGIGRMQSDINWDSGAVPLPPSNVTVTKVNESVVQVGWGWSWKDANQAELSWADHEDAWESTDGPQTFIVDSTNAGRWNIAGLDVGTWYIRIRLLKIVGESTTYGTYCDTKSIKLSSSPDTPALLLSDGVIAADGDVTCYWAYVSTDGTAQMQAEICEATYNYVAVENPTGSPLEQGWYELVNSKYVRSYDTSVTSGKIYYQTGTTITYSNPIASTATSQHISLHAADYGWNAGETHNLAVRVTSASGEQSEGWSAPVPVMIAEKLSVNITQHSLTEITVTSEDDEGDPVTRTVLSLTSLPLTVKAEGAGIGGTTTYIVERASSYHMDRPDGSDYDGFEGETIILKTQDGNDTCTITQEELLGVFDDGGSYRIIAIAKDSYGQTAETSLLFTGSYEEVTEPIGSPVENGYYELVSNEYVLSSDTEVNDQKTYYQPKMVDSFEVHWTHQAIIPTATISIDSDKNVTFITPVKPTGWVEGDVADIYRLSADPPEQIISGGDFGTKYVDPYPTLGSFGGHRVVYRTLNGDYITEYDTPAWTDYTAEDEPSYKHDLFGIVIDFDGEQLILPYNVSVSGSWKKDFTVTKYLGGSVQGDWNPGIDKTATATTVIPVEVEPDKISALRRLAVYPGICHVRTPDGSSYSANIDVKDNREEKWTTRLSKVSLEITRLDTEGFDGMTYDQWIEEQE